MDYFMGRHNEDTLKGISMGGLPYSLRFAHLAIPYEIISSENGIINAKIKIPFYKVPEPLLNRTFDSLFIERAKRLGVLERDLIPGDLVICHGLNISSTCEKQDLERYAHLYTKPAKIA